jgi:hypothetical protein
MTALPVRIASLSMPREKPTAATNRPIATKAAVTFAARATGPKRCSLAAVPKTIGTSGNTQGERIDTLRRRGDHGPVGRPGVNRRGVPTPVGVRKN